MCCIVADEMKQKSCLPLHGMNSNFHHAAAIAFWSALSAGFSAPWVACLAEFQTVILVHALFND